MALKFTGSICLSDIDKSQIKVGNDGKLYVNFSIHESKEPFYGTRENGETYLISDHFLSCAPKKEERVEGANYIFGNCRTWVERAQPIDSRAVEAAAPIAADVKLPWE